MIRRTFRRHPRNAMNGTPRLRSGFPSTPATTARRQLPQETPSTIASVSSSGSPSARKQQALPLAPETAPVKPAGAQPLIPLTVLDAPSQRFYAFGLYVALLIWKLYNWVSVVEEGEGSWSLFLKWIIIDCAYFFILPELRIPWLEPSQAVVTSIYLVHVVINWFLMFLIPVKAILTPGFGPTNYKIYFC